MNFGFEIADFELRKRRTEKSLWAGLFTIVVALMACQATTEAQQPAKKIARIGLLIASSPSPASPRVEAFRHGLRELGYVEGKNIVIDYRYGEGKPDRLPALAAELVRLKIDIIVTGGSAPTRAAKDGTAMIPIVMMQDVDPVGNGFIASLARPGGNITGLSAINPELSTKQLEVAREIIPKVSRLAVLYDPRNPVNIPAWKEIEHTATALRIKLLPIEVRAAEDYEPAFAAATQGRVEGLLVRREPLNQTYRTRIVSLAARNKLPAIYPGKQYVEVGGLMSYGVDSADLNRRAATYVDKILKGAKPADLPVEQPMKFELVINLKAAKQIGLAIPQSVLYRADKVIK
jgi:putative ABC transport system substrate-binding protein